MVRRSAAGLARQLAREFKVVAVLGPRQAGKTTLARAIFRRKPYVTMEDPDEREFARSDPRGFLARFPHGAVLDEAQRCPDLFSYIQGVVDGNRRTGQFVLTGSQHFLLQAGLRQTLAGRVGLLRLLPFSRRELAAARRAPATVEEAIFRGGYPPLYDQPVTPVRWLNAYLATYVERDIRDLLAVRDLSLFQRFVQLCAGWTGQQLNLARLGADCGIDQKTAMTWLGLLETSFIVFRLAPHHENFRKRIVKTPKLYFHDAGLACRLLGIETADQVLRHPQRGALFETWVIGEVLKERWAAGEDGNLHYWRDHVGHEVDLLVPRGERLQPVEIKSGATLASDWFSGIHWWMEQAGERGISPALVYGGETAAIRTGVRVIPWSKLPEKLV